MDENEMGVNVQNGEAQDGADIQSLMREAKEFVEDNFGNYSPEARATLIATYVRAATDSRTVRSLDGLADASSSLSIIARAVESFSR